MRDDAVLGRALPLDRGLGPISVYSTDHSILFHPNKGHGRDQ